MYTLNHIYNEDAYKAVKNINNDSVDCIYIDIPYLYSKGGKSSKIIGKRLSSLYETIKDISNGIDYSIFDEFNRVMKKINIFIWCSIQQIKDVMDYWLSKKNIKMEILVWCKSNSIPKNNSLLSNIEYCLWFRDKSVKINGSYHNKSKYYLSATNNADKKRYKHSTIKPLEFVKNHIICSTNENDLVIDFFSGSGTTAVACKQLNRNFICFEIREDYYKNSLLRLNENFLTNQKNDYEQLTLF